MLHPASGTATAAAVRTTSTRVSMRRRGAAGNTSEPLGFGIDERVQGGQTDRCPRLIRLIWRQPIGSAASGAMGWAPHSPLRARPIWARASGSGELRQHLGGDELEVVEVAHVDELQVHAVGAELAEPLRASRRRPRGARPCSPRRTCRGRRRSRRGAGGTRRRSSRRPSAVRRSCATSRVAADRPRTRDARRSKVSAMRSSPRNPILNSVA